MKKPVSEKKPVVSVIDKKSLLADCGVTLTEEELKRCTGGDKPELRPITIDCPDL